MAAAALAITRHPLAHALLPRPPPPPQAAAGRRARRHSCRAGGGSSATDSPPPPREVLQRWERAKLDSADDREWYAQPRFVQHVDATFRAQVTQLYRERIPDHPDVVVLDLMSSWVSHLPPERTYARVVGLGLNAAELARNPALSEWVVRDLNAEPDGYACVQKSAKWEDAT